MQPRLRWSLLPLTFASLCAFGQPCLVSNTFTASTPPVNGTYGCGETVTFCFTVTNWNSTNANWFHGVAANFGPGWDMSTLTPGPPPASCSGSGSWAWYPSVQGTAGTNIGTQGPGFFYDYNPGDGNPGNNFGDFCTGAVNWTFCWTISVLDGPACVNGLSLDVSVNSFGDSETGSWGSTGCTGDPIAVNPPTVIQSCTADAGSDAALTTCSSGGVSDLFNTLGGTPDAGGVWTAPDGSVVSGILNPTTDDAGAYTYTVTSLAPPCSAQAQVIVTISDQPNAGGPGNLTLCSSNPPANLFSVIEGSPDPGGVWTAPDGSAHTGIFDPATDVPGIYSYTVVAVAPCIPAVVAVTVSVVQSPNAGINASMQTCTSASSFSLFTQLNGVPNVGGVWTGPNGAPISGIYNPAMDPAGVYTYTVNGVAPCPNSSATVTVQNAPQPNAGTDGPLTTLCSAAPPVDLYFLLGGTPDLGGSWTAPDGGPTSGVLNPSTAQPGTYSYLLLAAAPCVSDQATVQIAIVDQPDVGVDGAITLCTASDPLDLFDALGGSPDAGGAWTDPAGSASLGILDPAVDMGGTFTYTIAAMAPCMTSSSAVEVDVVEQPNAGNDGAINACSSEATVDLFPFLGDNAQTGGIWTDPNGNPTGANVVPLQAAIGTYTYTVAAPAPCTNSSAQVVLSVLQAIDPGVDAMLTACSTDGSIDLFPLLGGTAATGGTWVEPTGGPSNGIIDPSDVFDGYYGYVFGADGPCPSVSSGVDVFIQDALSAGIDGAVPLCSEGSDLFPLISAITGAPASGGTWTGPDGQNQTGTFNAGSDAAGTYTYTIAAVGVCPAITSSVAMSIIPAAQAGLGGLIDICAGSDPIDPSEWLSGSWDPNGTWTGPNGAIVDPVDPSNAASGAYQYTVQGTAPCPNAQAMIDLVIDPMPNPGSISALGLCANAEPVALFPLLGGSPDSGGSWSGPSQFQGPFDPTYHLPGIYVYSVDGVGACTDMQAQATVELTVHPLPQPSLTTNVDQGCAPLTVQLSAGTFNEPATVQWSFGDGGSGFAGTTTNHLYTLGGTFTVTALVTDAEGCTASATFGQAITVSNGPVVDFGVSPIRVSIDDPVIGLVHQPLADVDHDWTMDGESWDVMAGRGITLPNATVGTHTICLVGTDSLGCEQATCREIIVDDVLTVFVPNAFTPDGNAINETFFPSVIGLDEDAYLFTIHDRWGNEVFLSTTPKEGWNGSMRNSGEILPQDVYVWRLWVKEGFSTERREHFGTVTLLK